MLKSSLFKSLYSESLATMNIIIIIIIIIIV